MLSKSLLAYIKLFKIDVTPEIDFLCSAKDHITTNIIHFVKTMSFLNQILNDVEAHLFDLKPETDLERFVF